MQLRRGRSIQLLIAGSVSLAAAYILRAQSQQRQRELR
eukprot:COSAG01_NODE_13545_length_1569_cov_2.300000_1_plen_37_part_10